MPGWLLLRYTHPRDPVHRTSVQYPDIGKRRTVCLISSVQIQALRHLSEVQIHQIPRNALVVSHNG